ncbi:hypothetical protein KPL35_14180 [Clostridium sp. CF011]|uniref:hypothetical protein n=1 Tax=unclassified Clostridium TaxID=2614128 RepID=UPI001C0C9B16|nr:MULTISPECIES: hypothetical protein [unclassified Clostridium]MBU3093219.1 hypothetical protein [Clostridium sp. CF011]MBW9144718.1 hypothetical protein [Clostridium sp. CM027]UVE40532.1 hypothetical protein KTC92_15630 [Clostridium sp. CM027]WAG69492.1 hypothetical protein LL036_16085 [Clostridium sp. CF011]
MNLYNENSLFYKSSRKIVSVAIFILFFIHIFNSYNGIDDKSLLNLVMVCVGIDTLLYSILQLKKQNIIGFILLLLIGVCTTVLGITFLCK